MSWVFGSVVVAVVVSQVLPYATLAVAHAAAVVAAAAEHGPLDAAAAVASWQTRRFPRLLGERAPPPAALPWQQLQRRQQLGHRHQRQERHHLIETHRKRL